jgi:hypothetical protein
MCPPLSQFQLAKLYGGCSNPTLLVFKDAAVYQVIYMGSHLPEGEAHLVSIERPMEYGRG